MAAAKKAKVLATFKHPMQIEVREAKFEPLESVGLLDHARLRRGNHRVEIGFAEGGCCKRAVTAIVKNGMVTDIEIADCEGSKKPASKEMLGVIQAAQADRHAGADGLEAGSGRAIFRDGRSTGRHRN